MNEAKTTWALIVGIDQYDGLSLPTLRASVADSLAAVEWLRALGVPDSQIFVHIAPSGEGQTRQVRLEDIDRAIDTLAEQPEADATRLFVFLSGYALYSPQDGPALLMQDATPTRLGRNLGIDPYVTLLRSMQFRRVFLFLNADLASEERALVRGPVREIGKRQSENSVVVCFATQPGQHAYEVSGSGLFMRHLLAALDSRNPDDDVVDIDPSTGNRVVDLYRVMHRHVIPEVRAESASIGESPQIPTIQVIGSLQSSERLPIFSLPPKNPIAGDVLAGYTSDTIGETDQLGIAADVNTLATLIASTQVNPPLSVGLFGDWGSGKSFFMRQLERRIALLAKNARTAKETAPTAEGYYCAHIAQITFNAWHYAEANLWASLASRIFEGLAEYLREEASVGDGVYRDVLELVSGLDRERITLREAEARRDALRIDARKDKASGQESDPPLSDFAARNPELDEQVDLLIETAGAKEAVVGVQEAVDTANDIAHLGSRIRAGWRELGKGEDRNRRITKAKLAGYLTGAAMLGIFLLVWLLENRKGVAAVASLLVSVVAGTAAVANVLLSKTRSALQAIQRVIDAPRREQLAAAEKAVEEGQARVRDLEARINALDPLQQSSLYRFVGERYAGHDYREHLGIVALIQRDLMALSEELLGQRPGHPGTDGQASLLTVERIVLYIDDLDRCPPKQVVDVLQAVHLLLAFPLFVVVVGVDARWLLRSLERQYAGFLSPDDTSASKGNDEEYWASTPQNYLEKIFQIPFWLRQMDATAYSELLGALLEDNRTVPNGTGPAGDASAKDLSLDRENGDRPSRGDDTLLQRQDAITLEVGQSREGLLAREQMSDAEPTPIPNIELAPQTLVIGDVERNFLKSLTGFVPTPRSAKRLINLYRLLKVSVGEEGVAAFEGQPGEPGEYQAVALLLAILIGFPALAPNVFAELERTDVPTWASFVDRLRPAPRNTPQSENLFSSGAVPSMTSSEAAAWRQLCRTLDALDENLLLKALSPFKNWRERVGRYSFGVGRILATS